MAKDVREFSRQMRQDRTFRQKILAAWKNGDLEEILFTEGYGFLPEELMRSVPQVRTGIRAGSCSEKFTCSCGP